MGRESLTHAEGVQLFRDYWEPQISTPFIQLLKTNLDMIPWQGAREMLNNPSQFFERLEQIGTEEKLEAHLAQLPEPPPVLRMVLLALIDQVLPFLKERLANGNALLPDSRGGRDRAFTIEQEIEIVEEINRRRRAGVALEQIYRDIAYIQDVSVPTIKRMWISASRYYESMQDKIEAGSSPVSADDKP